FASDRRAWDRVLDLLPGLALEVQDGAFAVARAVLCGYDNELSVALLRAAARRAGLVLGPGRARRLLALAQRPSGRGAPLGEGWSAAVAFDRLRVSRNDSAIGCALERILPAGERGSALFGEYEIAWSAAHAPERFERANYPVVARGETILWVPGICRSADGLPAPGTRAVRLDVTEHGAAQADRRA